MDPALSGTKVRILVRQLHTYPLPLTLISDFCPLLFTPDPDLEVNVKFPGCVVLVS